MPVILLTSKEEEIDELCALNIGAKMARGGLAGFASRPRRSAPLSREFRIHPAVIGIFFTVDRRNVWWIFIQVGSPNPKFLAVDVDPLPHAFA